MMKRIAFALLLCLWPAAAWATCASPISGKDGTGATINLGAVVDASSNCWGGNAIVDGTNAANKAAVKPASTAPAATDPALVVGLNPNNAANTVPWLMNMTQWAGGTLGAMANYGTSPGAVLVPGANVFMTNTPPVSQSGTWTVQPGNTPNTTPWAFNLTQVGGVSFGSAMSNLGTLASGTPATLNINNYMVGCASTVCNPNGAAAPGSASPVTPSNQPIGAAAFAATQVSCASTATSILAARTGVAGTGRVSATITNTTTTAIYIGGSGVTTGTGSLLPGIVGASLTINTTAAIDCIVTTGTATVTALETF
jgi:hypothetical protein